MARSVGGEYAQTDPLLGPSKNPKFGDYQANVAMSLGKQLKRKPREVAEAIAAELDVEELCDKVEVAGPGFINLYLRASFLSDQLDVLARDTLLGIARADPSQTVVVDYSSPNLAKEMHIGHIRSTCIGDSIVRVLEALGHRVIRQNHVGDWGTQFGMLLEHLMDTGWDRAADHTIADLDELYQAARRRFDDDSDFVDRARWRVVSLQGGDERTLDLWRQMIGESIRHMNGIYSRLGVRLTDEDIRPESFYNAMLVGVIEDLGRAGLLRESQGAKVVFCDGFFDPNGDPLPMIVQKSDGGYLYATTDLAGIRYRVRELKADRVIYVTDPRQSQHFAMVFQTVRRSGWAADDVRIEHVPFGTILGKNRKPFKTREGGTVRLSDVLDDAERRAAEVLATKNPDLDESRRSEIARVVGIGALKYADLSNDRQKDYVFDWDRMLALEGNTSPYLQNAYVRIRSIFRKGEIIMDAVRTQPLAVAHENERGLALKLLQFSTVVSAVGESLEPHRLCTYLHEVAALFHQFYENCPVLNAEDAATRDSRLRICDVTARTLRVGLDILGIGVVEQM